MLAEIGDVRARPGVHRARQGGRVPADGLRSPRLQELRPAREDHQGDRPTRCSRSPGRNPLLDIALELERIALEDEYFVSRKLYPNVDFYSGLIYEALGCPSAMFPVMFAIPRTAGWLAQWLEGSTIRSRRSRGPRQIYSGYGRARLRGRGQPPEDSARRRVGRGTVGVGVSRELYTVDPATGASATIAGVSVPNVDGIRLQGKWLWAVQNFNNQVARVRLSPDLTSGVD